MNNSYLFGKNRVPHWCFLLAVAFFAHGVASGEAVSFVFGSIASALAVVTGALVAMNK